MTPKGKLYVIPKRCLNEKNKADFIDRVVAVNGNGVVTLAARGRWTREAFESTFVPAKQEWVQ